MLYERFPCPCCGYRVFQYQPGSSERCPICAWEDDLAQLRFPLMAGSSNPQSLHEAQQTYEQIGACSMSRQADTREPLGERRDEEWRRLRPDIDNIERPQRGMKYADTYPLEDTTVLYYWRASFWRRRVS
ncbi:MAG: hydrolase [Gammaproteobacteria bacterium]|nr:hydrolase [Gammaproteobacteria bacterium]MCP5137624.1 hydrolase [Gammaproteobacteria bacterium]